MAFPKIALPLIVFGTAIINNLLLMLSVLLVFGLLGHVLSVSLFWLPFLMVLTLCLGAGLGLTLGVINVFIREIGQIMPIMLQFWFWLTPIVYVASIIPEKYHIFITLNPMSAIVKSYQDILIYGENPQLLTLIYPSMIAFSTLLLAAWIYFHANEEMTDVL